MFIKKGKDWNLAMEAIQQTYVQNGHLVGGVTPFEKC